MTREEIIKALNEIKECPIGLKAWYIIALEMAIKSLSQEPCDDVVSRQTVKEQMIKYGFHAPDMTVTEFVEDLPPVNQKSNECDYATMIASTDYEKVKEKGCNTCKHQLKFMCTEWKECKDKSKYEPQKSEE